MALLDGSDDAVVLISTTSRPRGVGQLGGQGVDAESEDGLPAHASARALSESSCFNSRDLKATLCQTDRARRSHEARAEESHLAL